MTYVILLVFALLLPVISVGQPLPKHPGLNAQHLLTLGKTQGESHLHSAAIKSYTAAIRKSPDLAEAYYLRGKAYERIGLYAPAIKDFSKYIDLKPKDVNGFLSRADAFNLNLDHNAALSDYNTAIKMAPNEISAYLGRGLAYAAIHKYPDAIKDYQWVLKTDPLHNEALGNMGVSCMLAGRHLEAMSYFEKALQVERDPQWRAKMEQWTQKLLQEAGGIARSDEIKKKIGPRALWWEFEEVFPVSMGYAGWQCISSVSPASSQVPILSNAKIN